jgi:16S rRNA pseudouridine516 synthase
MQSTRNRLDRFISARTGIKRADVRPLLAAGRILVDGRPATAINQLVHQFTRVQLDDQILQSREPRYLMLNKPAGVVSATSDDKHRTVVDLLVKSEQPGLHIAGRLDFNSTGLLLLTNDGRWSRRLSSPEQQVEKIYRVTLANRIDPGYVQAFANGMYFAYEGITTRPSRLRLVDEHTAEVMLVEGRYHQIKRMFGRFRNPVLELHRIAIGDLQLDPALAPGEYRALTPAELQATAPIKKFKGSVEAGADHAQ